MHRTFSRILSAALLVAVIASVPAFAGGALETLDVTGNVPSPRPGELVAKVIGFSWDARCISVQYRMNNFSATIPNPLGTLYDRVAALRQLVRDVPVAGHVLFGGGADFTKGRPRDVLSAAELTVLYHRPDAADLERLLVAFEPHWDRVKAAIEPAP